MKPLFQVLIICFTFLFSSCAGTYNVINPSSLRYSSSMEKEDFKFSYKHNVLVEKGNKKYAKKETKKNIKIVAVEFTNMSNEVVNVREDLLFYSGNKAVTPVEVEHVYKSFRQKVPSYLFYLLLSFLNITTTQTQNGVVTSQQVIPVGLIIGPGITAGNMIMASSSNKKFREELTSESFLEKVIEPGQTVYGLIGIYESEFNTISVSKRVDYNF